MNNSTAEVHGTHLIKMPTMQPQTTEDCCLRLACIWKLSETPDTLLQFMATQVNNTVATQVGDPGQNFESAVADESDSEYGQLEAVDVIFLHCNWGTKYTCARIMAWHEVRKGDIGAQSSK